MTVRIVRSILGSSIEVDGGSDRDAQVRGSLARILYLWGAISAKTAALPFPAVCAAEAARMPVAESSEPGVPRLEDEDEESAI